MSTDRSHPQVQKGRVTSFDVARKAGVSRTAVSLVLNGRTSARISDETRQRVLNAARELNYIPNAAAVSLVSGKTRTITLIVREPHVLGADWFTSQIIAHLSHASSQHRYRLQIVSMADPADYQSIAGDISGGRSDGAILLDLPWTALEQCSLAGSASPLVIIGASPVTEVDSLSTADVRAMDDLISHLVYGDRREIGYLHYATRQPDDRDRSTAFMIAAARSQTPVNARLLGEADFSPESGYAAMQRAIRSGPLPEAIIMGNDHIAMGALEALQDHGIRVPEDIAVTGFDDIPAARYLKPALTTWRQPVAQIAEAAIETLIHRMEVPDAEFRRQRFTGELIKRDSA